MPGRGSSAAPLDRDGLNLLGDFEFFSGTRSK